MAFSHRGIGDSDSDTDTNSLSREILRAVRWAALPCVAVFFASWSVAALTSLHSAAERASSGSFIQSSLTAVPQAGAAPTRKQTALAMLGAPVEKSTSPVALSPAQRKPTAVPFRKAVAEAKLSREKMLAAFANAGMAIEQASTAKPVDPFAKAVADAELSHEKLLAAFAHAGMAIEEEGAAEPVEVALAMPSAERFHHDAPETGLEAARIGGNTAIQPAAADPLSPLQLGAIGVNTELAYAAAEASPDSPVQLALASLALDPYGLDEGEPVSGEDYGPDAVGLPPEKPDSKPATADAEPEAKPERKLRETADDPALTARKPAGNDRQGSQQELAYAKPDKPAGAFNNLFNTPKAGKGVAIYDISAAVVHMPDGTKLEAHSGIGKMVDNPRYVHVKMNGPTPPNTYKLSMREKRFHGAEAVRMTPIGDQTMHGRDGILAHPYLLRGGRAESHGCVAIKDYQRFLKAFKQGKVTHIVVVPSMSKLSKVRLASIGRGA